MTYIDYTLLWWVCGTLIKLLAAAILIAAGYAVSSLLVGVLAWA